MELLGLVCDVGLVGDPAAIRRHRLARSADHDHVGVLVGFRPDSTQYALVRRAPVSTMDAKTTADGRQLYVDRETAECGSKGPFFVAYSTKRADSRWGYYCANCGAFDNAMDAMGRLKCNACANIKKPDEWDAAHE